MAQLAPEMADGALSEVFGEALLAQVGAELRSDLGQKWRVYRQSVDEERIKHEKENVLKENRTFELERDLDQTRQKLESTLQAQSHLNRDKETLDEKWAEAQRKTAGLQDHLQVLTDENGSLKRERDQLQGERNDVIEMAERRLTEIERLQQAGQTLSEQLIQANTAKCEAIVKMEEVTSQEVMLTYKEKRLQEEREYMTAQIATLTDQLSQKNEAIIRVRSEQTHKLAQLQSDLAQRSEQVKLLAGQEEALRGDLDASAKRCDELTHRLKAARESEMAVEENYRQELKAQTNLAELYKNHCDDSEKKAHDLVSVVEELQGLLKQSTERYGQLEDCLETERIEGKEELKRRNEAIRGLRKELTDANDLIKTLKSKGLTEEGIEKLSPSAAAASKLLKSGMSLTQIYSQLVGCQEELIQCKDENNRLNTYLDNILKEIEERAPLMKQQREDYERAVDAVGSLTRQLEDARHEYEFRKREALDSRQKSESAQRENRRMMAQVQDLGRQVVVLVREVEAARAGLNTSRQSLSSVTSDPNQSRDADSIISDRLVAFKDVGELQQKNIELLSVVRELSANQESAENRLVEEKTSELKHELELASTQVEQLREARQRQEVMVESIINERDMYKSLATAGGTEPLQAPMATSTPGAPLKSGGGDLITTPSPARAKTPYHELEKKSVAAETSLAEVKKEFDLYREEKCENQRMIEHELKESKESLQDLKIKCMKLSSQEEFNNERFKTSQANAQAYKKQMEILSERSNKLSGIVAKHESTIELLRNEILASQSKLSQAEVQLDFLKHEKSVLKAAEARLLQENEIIHRQKTSSAMVMENLNLVKLNLERQEQERNMRLENKNDALEKEVGLLRKKLDQEEKNYKQAVQAWEKAQADLRLKFDEAVVQEKEAVEKLSTLQGQCDETRLQLTETQEKLELAESSLAGRGVKAMSRSESQPEVSAKVRDLQLQLGQARNEVNNLKEQLEASKTACTNFKNLAESAEKRLSENNVAEKALKTDLEERLKQALEVKSALEAKLVEIEQAKGGSGEEEINLKETLLTTQNNLQVVMTQLAEAQRVEVECRAEMTSQMAIADEAQRNYERELVLHSKDVETMNELKSVINSHKNEVSEKEEALRTAQLSLEDIKANASRLDSSLKEEYARLQDQFKVVEKENKSLHDQLGTITEQMTSIQRHVECHPDASKSFSEDETKSTAQLMQIIKYLRREKEIITSKIEVAQAECTRVKSQSEHFQKQLEESQAALAMEREQSSSSAMSSSKYADLLQKVQTNSALSDSNKILREENETLHKQFKSAQSDLETWRGEITPLKDRIKGLEEKEGNLSVELITSKREVDKWKQRSNQLIEKQQLMNPETVKNMQNDISNLTQQLEKARLIGNKFKSDVEKITSEYNKIKAQLVKAIPDLRSKAAEIVRLQTEQKRLTEASAQLEAKMVAVERERLGVVAERDGVKQELLRERVKSSNLQKADLDNDKVKKEVANLKDQDTKKTTEIETLKKRLQDNRSHITRLKQVGRDFKEKADKFLKELTTLREEKAKLVTELAKAPATGLTASTGEAEESLKAKIEELERKNEEGETLIAETMKELESKDSEIKEQQDTIAEIERDLKLAKTKEKRALDVLKNCKAEMTRIKTENKELKAENAAMRTNSSLPPRQPGPSKAEYDAQKEQFESKLKGLSEEKEKLEEEYRVERERFQQQIEGLQHELQESNQKQRTSSQEQQTSEGTSKQVAEAVKASVKPMAGSSGTQRKQTTYPQAQVHPTRHVPAATIRPTAMRTPQQASVHPMVSVSPNSASQSTSANAAAAAAQLNPTVPEFVPRMAAATGTDTVESSDESTPRARVLPRAQDSDSDSGPSTSAGGGPSSLPGGSGPGSAALGTPGTTQKRPRDDPAPDSDAESKRARTAVATTEETETALQSSIPPPSSTTQEDEDVVEIVSSDGEDQGEEDDEQEDEDQEEELEDEQLDEDEGPSAGVAMDEVDEDANDGEEGEIEDEEDEEPMQQEEDEDVIQVEDTDDEDSNQYQVPEQSDETVVTAAASDVLGESDQPSSSSARQASSQDRRGQVTSVDDQGDSVVPGTPKLTPSQTQGEHFGNVPTDQSAQSEPSESSQFVFGTVPDVAVSSSSGSTTATLAAQDGVDRTALDITQFVQGTEGSSVQPSTSRAKDPSTSQLSDAAVTSPITIDPRSASQDLALLEDDLSQPSGGVSTSAQQTSQDDSAQVPKESSEMVDLEQVQSSEADDQGSNSQSGPSQGSSNIGAVSSSNRSEASAATSAPKRLNRNRIVFDLQDDGGSGVGGSAGLPVGLPMGRGTGAFRGARANPATRGNSGPAGIGKARRSKPQYPRGK